MADFDPDSVLTSPHPDSASMTVRPKLSRDDLEKLVRKYNPDITGNAVKGEVDNIQRESGGDASNDTGDHGTSGGLYQDHLSRLTGLKDFASKHGKDWTDPEIQVQYSRLEKERDYPSLLKLQQTSDDRSANEDAFKRIFERPASVLWQNNAEGRPVTESPRFNFSDWAMKEFMDRPDTDIRYMDPKEYLQLTPPLEDKPFESPSGRSLKKSVGRGDQVEQIPTLDVSVNGPTAQVTDQDGRHRALMAQQEGIQAIPVAVKGLKGNPTEIVGTDGVPQALDYPRQPRQEAPEQPKEPISLLQEAKDAVIPKAEAAEPEVPAWAREETPQSAVPAWAQESPQQGAAPTESMASKIGGAVADAAGAALIPGSGLVDPHLGSQIVNPDNAAAAARGLAPYAAGAGVGAAIGAPFAGVGAVPGAIAGAGAVGLDQLATGLMGLPGPQQATNALLDKAGVPQVRTPEQRIVENMFSSGANALSGAGALRLVGNALRNPASRATANYIESRASKIINALADNPGMQTVSGMLAGGASQGAAEAGLSPGMQWLAGLAASLIPGGKGMMPNLTHINASPEAKAAIDAGFVIPPAEATERHIGTLNPTNVLAAEAGKIKSGQLASARNQPVVNLKVQEDLGLPPGTTLTPEAFKQVRAREGQVYQEVTAAVPEVNLRRDPEFMADVAALGKRSESTERNFPSTTEPPEIASLREEMAAHSRAPTKDVMNYIADLRSRAVADFQAHGEGAAMAHRKGYAEREAANALEDAMERSVQNAPQYYREKLDQAVARRAEIDADLRVAQPSAGVSVNPISPHGQMIDRLRDARQQAEGEVRDWTSRLQNSENRNASDQTLVDRYRQARRIMAKSYDAESVTNVSTGDVSATGLGRLLQKGKPFTGNMKTIADAANNFRRAFQNPSAFGGVEPLSVLDAAFAAAQGAAALTNPGLGGLAHLAAGLGTIARHPLRSLMLSPGYQRGMIAPRTSPQVPLSALTTPMLPTQPVPGNPGNALLGLGMQQ